MEERTYNQEKVVKACICATKAMIEYSYAGPEDMREIADLLGEAVGKMRAKLSPVIQEKFDTWLSKKGREIKESCVMV